MKKFNRIAWFVCYSIAGAMCLHLYGHEALAAENAGNWRPIYDLVLRWFNFGIIVIIFIKYGKTPLMNFLQGRKEEIAREIERVEQKKEKATDKIKEIQKVIDASEVRFAELKERIVRQGERKKQEIIESTQQQSRMMIDDAKRRIDSQFDQAKSSFKAELIDTAIELAMQRLPQEITDEDNDKFTDQFMVSTVSD